MSVSERGTCSAPLCTTMPSEETPMLWRDGSYFLKWGCIRYSSIAGVLHIADDGQHAPSLERQEGVTPLKLSNVLL